MQYDIRMAYFVRNGLQTNKWIVQISKTIIGLLINIEQVKYYINPQDNETQNAIFDEQK